MALTVQVPTVGIGNSTEAVKVTNSLTNLNAWANGGIAGSDISSTAAITRPQLAGGFGDLVWTPISGTTSAADGMFYNAVGSFTITLPAPTANRTIGIRASSGQTGAAPLTVTASSGVIAQYTAAASMVLGMPGAVVVLVADGTNWITAAGSWDTGWVAPTLGNSWVNSGGTTDPVGYRKVGGGVLLRGSITSGTSAAFTLPAGFRPTGDQQRPVAGSNSSLQVAAATGVVTPPPATVDLGSVSFSTV